MTAKTAETGTPLDLWKLRVLEVPRFKDGITPKPCALALLGWLIPRGYGGTVSTAYVSGPMLRELLGVRRETLGDALAELDDLGIVKPMGGWWGRLKALELHMEWDVISELLLCNDSFLPDTTKVLLPVTRHGVRNISLTTRMVWGWLWSWSHMGQFRLHFVTRNDAALHFGPSHDGYALPFSQLEAMGLIDIRDRGYGGRKSPMEIRMCTRIERLTKYLDVEPRVRREDPDGED